MDESKEGGWPFVLFNLALGLLCFTYEIMSLRKWTVGRHLLYPTRKFYNQSNLGSTTVTLLHRCVRITTKTRNWRLTLCYLQSLPLFSLYLGLSWSSCCCFVQFFYDSSVSVTRGVSTVGSGRSVTSINTKGINGEGESVSTINV